MYVVPGTQTSFSLRFRFAFSAIFLFLTALFLSSISLFLVSHLLFLTFLSPYFLLFSAVIPHQMVKAGYSLINTATVCSAMSALACCTSAFLTNLPFVVSPPAAVSVFLAVYLRNANLSPHIGNIAVVYSGVGLAILGLLRPLTVIFYKVKKIKTAKRIFVYIRRLKCDIFSFFLPIDKNRVRK